MSSKFQPKLHILLEPQRRLWPQLKDVPGRFVLCGGTAIALHFGHRSSVDFDFVAAEGFDPDALYEEIPVLKGSKAVQKSANTLTCVIECGGPVQVSFFGAPALGLVEPPRVAADNGLQVASVLDLAGMKAAVVQKRAEAKDYLDLDAIMNQGEIDLPTALAAARVIYGPTFNPELTLKSLCYFGDGDLSTLPQDVQDRLAEAVQSVDLDQLPVLNDGSRPTGHNRGQE